MSEALVGGKQVAAWIKGDPIRWELLGHVRELGLPDCWIAAGFVRNAVWNILHDRQPGLSADIDVIWFDRRDPSEARDRLIECRLHLNAPHFDWSVKNQARMHIGNGDEAYRSSEDAMRFWPETATAVGVRRTVNDLCEVIAPFGLDDLLELKLRPAGHFAHLKRSVFKARAAEKAWLTNFPKLRLVG